jgi:ankyrin repeat protein
MRKIFITPIVIFIWLCFAGVASASPLVFIDDKLINFPYGVSPIVENDRTLVPFRNIFEAMGADVQWDKDSQTVTAKKDDITISLTIGGLAYKNGEPITLDVPAKIINNRTMVPLRFVGEAFGAIVDWNQDFQAVLISTSGTKNNILDNYLALDKLKINEFLIAETKEGHGGAVEKLLAAGADLNSTDQYGTSALMHASKKGYTYTVKALIAAGADVNYKDEKYGFTALSFATDGEQGDNQADTVKVLLEAGAKPNICLTAGWTPLTQAAAGGRTEVVKALLAGGADPNYKAEGGFPALHSTLINGADKTEIVKALIKAGANVNEIYKDRTPLMIAVTTDNLELVKIFLNAGANPNVKSSEGLTALTIAKVRGNTDIINLLKESKAEESSGYLTYTNKAYGYKIKYPENWFKKEGDNIVSFISPKDNASDVFAVNLNITNEFLNDKQITLDQYVNLGLEYTKKFVITDFNVVESSETNLAGIPSKRIIATGKQGELSLKFLRICAINNNRAYNITYTAVLDTYPKYLNTAQEIIDSFEWVPTYTEEMEKLNSDH